MRNEMGNNNVSGVKEEEKAAADVAVSENEAQTQDFNAKGEESPSNDPSAAKDSNAERHELNRTETGDKEPDSQFPGDLTEANTSVSQEGEIQKAGSSDEGNYEKALVSNLEEIIDIPRTHDYSSIQKDTNTEEVEGSNSTCSDTISLVSEPANDSTRLLEKNQHLPSGESGEVLKTSITCNIEEKENFESGIDREENIAILVPEESHTLEDKSVETSISKETDDTKIAENKVGDGLKNQDDCEEHPRVTSRHFFDSPLEGVPQDSSLDPFPTIPEPQEKRVVHGDETNSKSGESENGGSKQDSNQTNSSEQAVNQMIMANSVPSTMLHEAYCKENGEENIGSRPINNAEEVKVTHNRSKSVLADNKMFDPLEQFKITVEVTKMLPTTIPVSTEFSSSTKNDGEEGATTEKREDFSSSGASNTNIRRTEEECTSTSDPFKWENVHIDPPSNSKALESSKLDKKPALDLETTSGKLAESEKNLSSRPNECYKAQGNSARISVESNPEHPNNRVHVRKSPSFDFGLPLDARSQESDQTPLLHHDKSATRTFSGCDNARFQSRITETDYGRRSLDYEPVTVEEKTIRMERSDSDVSIASFVSLLKKEQKANVESKQEKQDQIHVADNKTDELQGGEQELALTSIRGRGKRKPRSSLFSACMCCTAAIR